MTTESRSGSEVQRNLIWALANGSAITSASSSDLSNKSGFGGGVNLVDAGKEATTGPSPAGTDGNLGNRVTRRTVAMLVATTMESGQRAGRRACRCRGRGLWPCHQITNTFVTLPGGGGREKERETDWKKFSNLAGSRSDVHGNIDMTMALTRFLSDSSREHAVWCGYSATHVSYINPPHPLKKKHFYRCARLHRVKTVTGWENTFSEFLEVEPLTQMHFNGTGARERSEKQRGSRRE